MHAFEFIKSQQQAIKHYKLILFIKTIHGARSKGTETQTMMQIRQLRLFFKFIIKF